MYRSQPAPRAWTRARWLNGCCCCIAACRRNECCRAQIGGPRIGWPLAKILLAADETARQPIEGTIIAAESPSRPGPCFAQLTYALRAVANAHLHCTTAAKDLAQASGFPRRCSIGIGAAFSPATLHAASNLGYFIHDDPRHASLCNYRHPHRGRSKLGFCFVAGADADPVSQMQSDFQLVPPCSYASHVGVQIGRHDVQHLGNHKGLLVPCDRYPTRRRDW